MRLFLQKTMHKITLILLLSLILQGCETFKNFKSSDANQASKYADWSAKKIYDSAKAAMDKSNYDKAIEFYEILESRYPFGAYIAQMQLNIAYCYFKNENPESAITAADRFIKIYPRNPHVDYAYYLKGVVNFNRGIRIIDRFLPTDSSQRNLDNTQESYDNFQVLIQRFPNSQYTPDAKQRALALRNNIAAYEIHVARFYIKRKAYIAAANRANYVIKTYQQTPSIPYALQIMQEAYSQLGLHDLAADTAKVYQQNFPHSVPVMTQRETTIANKVWNFIGLDR